MDLAIVGDGPAACAAARTAARHGIRTLLIAPSSEHRPGLLELLAATARPALSALGLDAAALVGGDALLRTQFRWGREDPGERVTPPSPAAATIIDRAEFDSALLAGALAAGAEHMHARVVAWRKEGDGWALETLATTGDAPGDASGVVQAARVLVGTGRGSRLMQRAGAPRLVRHRMVAVIQRVNTERFAGRLIVEPTSTGWWYGMGREQSAIVGFVTDADLLAGGLDRAAATWNRERTGVEWVPPAGELELRPAVVAGVAPGGETGVLPVGDAALAVDPLSGHGLRFALESGIRAVLEPQHYVEWLMSEHERHADDEHALYQRETRFSDSLFWQRHSGRRAHG